VRRIAHSGTGKPPAAAGLAELVATSRSSPSRTVRAILPAGTDRFTPAACSAATTRHYDGVMVKSSLGELAELRLGPCRATPDGPAPEETPE